MADFTTLLERHGILPLWSIEIAGWGRRTGATSADLQKAYRFCNADPAEYGYTADQADRYFDLLEELPGVISEEIDFRSGSTTYGALGASLVDAISARGLTHGWGTDGLLAPLTGTHAAVGLCSLTVAVNSVQTAWTVNDTTGLAEGQALWIGTETVTIEAVPDGTHLTVIRGTHGTVAVPHGVGETDDTVLYDRPCYLRGRELRVYVNLINPQTQALLDETEEHLVWSGVVEDCEVTDTLVWEIQGKPGLSALDRSLGRKQWHAEATGSPGVIQPGANLAVDIDPEAEAQEPGYTPAEYGDQEAQDFYARLEDGLIRATYVHPAGSPETCNLFAAREPGLLGTAAPEYTDKPLALWDVLCTAEDPYKDRTDGSTPLHNFTLDGEFTAHPVDIMLALMTSTGTGTNWDWDILPQHWGAGVPYTLIDFPSFRAVKARQPNLSFGNLIIGWEGKPFALRRYLEDEFLLPLGWFLYLNAEGEIALGQLTETYPGETYPTITQDEVVDVPRVSFDLQSTIAVQNLSYEWDWAKEEYTRSKVYIDDAARERLAADDSEVTLECKGISAGSGAILGRAQAFAKLWTNPYPRISASVPMDRMLDLDVAGRVSFTFAALPNPLTGTRGYVAQPCFILSRALNIDENAIDLVLLALPDLGAGLWAPSAAVSDWYEEELLAGVFPNDFTDGNQHDSVPLYDARGFAVGDWVVLTDAAGALRSDNTVQVTVVADTALTFSAAFEFSGNPITPVEGDVIVFCRWWDGDPPYHGWTDRMKEHVALADSTDGMLPDDTTDPFIYGL